MDAVTSTTYLPIDLTAIAFDQFIEKYVAPTARALSNAIDQSLLYDYLPRWEIQPSQIDSKGLFACRPLRGRRKLGCLTGQIVSVRESRRLMRGVERKHCWEFSSRGALIIDGPFRFINASNKPNLFFREVGQTVEVWTLHDIQPGEEMTAKYDPFPWGRK